jgi:hypothetical protein
MDRDDMLQLAVGTLADIAFSDDMTLEVAKHKAARIYQEIQEAQEKGEEE